MGKVNQSRKKVTSTKKLGAHVRTLNKAKTRKFIRSILEECLDRAGIFDEVPESPENQNEEHAEMLKVRGKEYDTTDDNLPSTSATPQEKTLIFQETMEATNESVSRKSLKPNFSPLNIENRRIVDISFFLQQLQDLNMHAPQFGCSINNLIIYNEVKAGLNSKFLLHCNMCNANFSLKTSKDDINMDAVEGIMSTGSGFYNSEELFSVLNVPYMSSKLYTKCHEKVSEGWEVTAQKLMKEAADEEAAYAISKGNVDKDGIPLITVVADGCWSKRSYRTNYSALSGAAAIVGNTFGKVLFLAVKNKYCSICSSNLEAQEHICFKNYSGSSTGMESESLAEGFRLSESMYGLRYATMIADGDSSTYKKILETRPYKSLTVEKVECRNHLLRNYCNKLKTLSTDTRFPICNRKIISKNILRLRTAVTSAIAYRSKNGPVATAAVSLKKDIDNSIYHVFGEHTNCEDYFCKKDRSDTNYIEEFRKCPGLLCRLNEIISYISNNSRSLIKNVDSNKVEQFNSIINKFIGGKRINFTQRGSYQARCHGAVVSFNSQRPHYEIHKTLYGTSPKKLVKRLEDRRRKKIDDNKSRRLLIKHKRKDTTQPRPKQYSSGPDEFYGGSCMATDLDDDIFDLEKEKFLKNLERTPEERLALERSTILQSESGFWLEERRKLLTASNFFSVCTRRPTTGCAKLVIKLLYKTASLSIASINHGQKYEQTAIRQLEEQEGVVIEPSGLFIHDNHPFLGATPDGLVGSNLVVEIKCPYSAYGMEVGEGIQQNKIRFWTFDRKTNSYAINEKHSWFYQIQGQLNITGRKGCIFAVWTGQQFPLKVEYIRKKKDFWKNKMEQKLEDFYKDCLLPELVDPRHTRKLPIREPIYISEARKKKESVRIRKLPAKRKLF